MEKCEGTLLGVFFGLLFFGGGGGGGVHVCVCVCVCVVLLSCFLSVVVLLAFGRLHISLSPLAPLNDT